jgi:hypothetical protein
MPTGDRTLHGAMYVGVFGRRCVCILFQDVEPDHVESLKLAERAVATFRLAPPDAAP